MTENYVLLEVDRNPRHTHEYLRFESPHPPEHRLDVIRALRDTRPSARRKNLAEGKSYIREVLTVSGYTKWTWNIPGNKKTIFHPSVSREKSNAGHVSIGHISGATESISRKMEKPGMVLYMPVRTISLSSVPGRTRAGTGILG